MKAVILAAGEGKRLRPFTETMPKVMLPVANKPVLEYVVDAVKKSGISDIIIVVGYKKEVIMEHFKDYEGVDITYVVQDKQLGTAHALLQAKKHVKSSFMVLSGDNIIDQTSISQLINDKSKYSMLIKKHSHPSKYGVVFVETGILKEIIEKPKEDLEGFISTGIYKLPHSVFDDIEKLTSQGVYALSSIIQSLVDQGKEINTISARSWMDIVYPWDLITVNEAILRTASASTSGTIEKGVTIKGGVVVGKDTAIRSGCYIVGPVIIGEGCEIGPNACIFPSTTIGNHAVVHPFCEIRNSVILDDSRVGSNSYISHSVVGRGSILGHNFSATAGKATIEMPDEFKKLDAIGVMVGEDCNIGSNVIVEPGIFIGRGCKISPMKRIINHISSESKVM
jgi:UDP-N-acetylglucosamine diphosphorylase/glucosamine-1-phosphate N-acetyltransferase